jgi:hypothetical protein
MKYIILLFALIITPELFAQCNPSTIYGNDTTNAVCFEIQSNVRRCYSNNIPNHQYGPFGPNNIQGQDFDYSMCLYPELDTVITPLVEDASMPGCSNGIIFGVSTQGVNFSPFARLYWVNTATQQENMNWIEEANFILNMDLNGGHVNSVNRYHYHDISYDHFINNLGIDGTAHSPIVGWAADGFPIYYKYLYTDSLNLGAGVSDFQSSYVLKSGNRPGNGVSEPNGPYDGHYVQDYEYIANLSSLDECGGRFGVTPDYPNGTYYYVLTDNWPYIPRCLKGKWIDNSFRLGFNCPVSTANTDCSIGTSIVNIGNAAITVNVFPNPSTDFINIEMEESFDKTLVTGVKIYNVQGQAVYYAKDLDGPIPTHNLERGIYFVQIDLINGQKTKKIVVE